MTTRRFWAALTVASTVTTGLACSDILQIPPPENLTPAVPDAGVDTTTPILPSSDASDAPVDTKTPDACVDTNSDSNNCGRCGHSCLGGVCQGGKCLPYALVKNGTAFGFRRLAMTGHTIVALHAETDVDDSVVTIDGNTGTMNTLASGESIADDIVTDGADVYWLTENSSIRKCSLSGCPAGPTTIVSLSRSGPSLSVSNGRLYYASSHAVAPPNFAYTVESTDTDGKQPLRIVDNRTQPTEGILNDGQYIYWTESDLGLFRAKTSPPGTPEPLGGNGTSGFTVKPVAIDSQRLAWRDWERSACSSEGDSVWTLPMMGDAGAPTNLTPNDMQIGVMSVALHGGYVYWTTLGEADGGTFTDGALRRCKLPACSPIETIADRLARPYSLVVDDSAVYFGEAGNTWGKKEATLWRWAL